MNKLKVILVISGGLIAGGSAVSVNATTIDTNYRQDVALSNARDVSQSMAINDHYAYIARKHYGLNSMYLVRVDLNTGNTINLGNRDIGHANGMTYWRQHLFVTRTGGQNTSGKNVNVYKITPKSVTYEKSFNIYDEQHKKVNISANAWDDKHQRMIYIDGPNVYIAKTSNPYESNVVKVPGKLTQTNVPSWVKTSSVGQAITVDGANNNLYYVRSYNKVSNKSVAIGNKSYVGSVNLDKLVEHHKLVNGSVQKQGSYRGKNDIFEIEGLAVQHNKVWFNTTNRTTTGDSDFIAHWS